MPRIVYPRIVVTFKDGTYSNPSFKNKRKIDGLISRLRAKVDTFEGDAVIQYAKSYNNSFSFTSEADLRSKVYPSIEKELLNEFETKKDR